MASFTSSDITSKLREFKSFSVVALKAGGSKTTLKLDDGDGGDLVFSFIYKPTARGKNFTLVALGQEIKGYAKTNGDKLVVDLRIPEVFVLLAKVKGIPLKKEFYIEFDVDVTVGEKSITVQGEYDDEPWSVIITVDGGNDESDDFDSTTLRRESAVSIRGNVGVQTFGVKVKTTNEYTISDDTFDLIDKLRED
jgi:hypothetical protein